MKTQRGVTLIVVLVLLLLVTLGGVEIMRGAKFQQLIVNTYEEKELVFQAAETALRWVEDNVVSTTAYGNLDFEDGCGGGGGGGNCFNAACVNGLCDTVTYPFPAGGGANIINCQPDGSRVWEDPAKWLNANALNVLVARNAGLPMTVTAQYLIEFRCYVQNVADPSEDLGTGKRDATEWAEYYRITVQVNGITLDDGTERGSPVMLQSTVKKN
jgi:Tfp pilus assembly protein PilX